MSGFQSRIQTSNENVIADGRWVHKALETALTVASSNHHGATTNCLRNLSREEWMVPASIAPSGVGGEGRNLEVEWCEVLRVAAGVLVVGRAGGGGGGRGRGEVHP